MVKNKEEEILNATNIVCLNCVEDTLNKEEECDNCPVRKLCESLEINS